MPPGFLSALELQYQITETRVNPLLRRLDMKKTTFLKRIKIVVMVLVLCVPIVIGVAHGDSIKWEVLSIVAMSKYQAGQYTDAVIVAQKALEIAEHNVGSDHSHVVISLNNLAMFYRTHGEYAQAEPLYQRALAIKEKAMGLAHPQVVNSLEDLAGLYRATKQEAKAERLERRATFLRSIKG